VDAAAQPVRTAPPDDFGHGLPDGLAVTLSPQAMLVPEPCIVGDFITMKPALHHPDLKRPVAFLGGCEVATLLRPLQSGMALSALMDAWKIPIESKVTIAGWLLKYRVLRRHRPRRQTEEGCCGQGSESGTIRY
jgi:hypothetical protein